MVVVKVPRTPKSSFNKDRPPSALLKDQIKHLEWAVLPALQRDPKQLKKIKQVKTEAHAADRIAQLTTMVLEAKAAPPPEEGAPPHVVLPPVPRAPRERGVQKRSPKAALKAKGRHRTKKGKAVKKGKAAKKGKTAKRGKRR